LLQERLIGVERVGVARFLPIPFFVEFLDARLSLGAELAAGIFLQEQLIGVGGVRGPRLLPVALLAAAAGQGQRGSQGHDQKHLFNDHFHTLKGLTDWPFYFDSRRRQARHTTAYSDAIRRGS
jgi:hypothetical protein